MTRDVCFEASDNVWSYGTMVIEVFSRNLINTFFYSSPEKILTETFDRPTLLHIVGRYLKYCCVVSVDRNAPKNIVIEYQFFSYIL